MGNKTAPLPEVKWPLLFKCNFHLPPCSVACWGCKMAAYRAFFFLLVLLLLSKKLCFLTPRTGQTRPRKFRLQCWAARVCVCVPMEHNYCWTASGTFNNFKLLRVGKLSVRWTNHKKGQRVEHNKKTGARLRKWGSLPGFNTTGKDSLTSLSICVSVSVFVCKKERLQHVYRVPVINGVFWRSCLY